MNFNQITLHKLCEDTVWTCAQSKEVQVLVQRIYSKRKNKKAFVNFVNHSNTKLSKKLNLLIEKEIQRHLKKIIKVQLGIDKTTVEKSGSFSAIKSESSSFISFLDTYFND